MKNIFKIKEKSKDILIETFFYTRDIKTYSLVGRPKLKY